MFKGIAVAALAAAFLMGAYAPSESAQKVRFNFTSESAAKKSRYQGKKVVRYRTSQSPGTIVINTTKRKLYLVMEGGKAMEYGVGVGRQGFSWAGGARIARKAKWPAWHPPAAMRKREPHLPKYMEGGPEEPIGCARALSLPGQCRHAVPDPRHVRAAHDRSRCVQRLYPHAQRRSHRSLPARQGRRPGRRQLTRVSLW